MLNMERMYEFWGMCRATSMCSVPQRGVGVNSCESGTQCSELTSLGCRLGVGENGERCRKM